MVRRSLQHENYSLNAFSENFEGGLTCLSLAVCQDAPIDVIDAIIRADRSLITNRDVFGLNVLHLGCLNGASLSIIQYIARCYGSLLRQLDVDRRTPLHHAVEYAIHCVLEDQDAYFYYIEVLEELCQIAPDLVIIQDVTGISPIDMVQDVKVRTEVESMEYDRLEIVYDVLKSASIEDYKAKQKDWVTERLIREENARKVMKRKTTMPPLGKLRINKGSSVKTTTCSSFVSSNSSTPC